MLNIIYSKALTLLFLAPLLEKGYLSITRCLYYYIVARVLVGRESFTTRFAH
jgi:hypothetical protein